MPKGITRIDGNKKEDIDLEEPNSSTSRRTRVRHNKINFFIIN
tara:strand:+ start:176 stop:304 length:129 start_codon:yes stop_codon:yes gene_type:complete